MKYLPSRVAPAISGVIVLAALTRTLPIEEYGRFALCTASMMMLQAVFMQWLSLGIIRFHTAATPKQHKRELAASVSVLFGIETPIVFGFCCIAAFAFFEEISDRIIIMLSFIYYIAFSLFNLIQRLHIANLQSMRFSLMATVQTVLSGSFAIFLPWFIFPSASFAIGGMILGLLIACALDFKTTGNFFRLSFARHDVMKRVLQFSWPIIPQSGLAILIGRMDRFILTIFIGTEAVGQYNAAFSLVDQALSSLFLLVALIAHPLAISTYGAGNPQALNDQLNKNLTLMLGLALPAGVGLCAIRSELSGIILGEGFRQTASDLIPALTTALIMAGIKDHYIAHSFHLARKMWLPIIMLLPVATASILANYLLIPGYGVMGAAYVMLGAQASALILGYILTRWAVPMPVPLIDITKISIAAGTMGALLHILPEAPVWISLGTKLVLGVMCYSTIVLILNPTNIRQKIWATLPGRSRDR